MVLLHGMIVLHGAAIVFQGLLHWSQRWPLPGMRMLPNQIITSGILSGTVFIISARLQASC